MLSVENFCIFHAHVYVMWIFFSPHDGAGAKTCMKYARKLTNDIFMMWYNVMTQTEVMYEVTC